MYEVNLENEYFDSGSSVILVDMIRPGSKY